MEKNPTAFSNEKKYQRQSLNEQISYNLKRYLNIRSVASPKFSPEGDKVVFLSNLTGVNQVWMTEARATDRPSLHLLSIDSEERVGFVEYATSKDLIAYGVDRGGNERYQINVLEGKGERFKKITDNPRVIHEFGAFSRDETKLTFSSNLRDATFFDLYIQEIEADTNSGELVYQSDETNHPVEWSPDGKYLLFKKLYAPFNHQLFMLELSSRAARPLLPHEGDAVFNYATFGEKDHRFVYCITDLAKEFTELARIDLKNDTLEPLYQEASSDIEIMQQSPNGSLLAFSVNIQGFSKLKILDLKTLQTRELSMKLPKDAVVLDFSWSQDSSKIALTLTSSILNTDLFIYDLKTDEFSQITKVSTSGIPESAFVPAELWKYPSFDELEVSSFLFLPKKEDYDDHEGHPLLVYLHGGPESQFRPTFNHLIQCFLNLGFAVGVPNFRGSTGYGRTFTHLDDVTNRMNTVRDVESFLSRLRAREDLRGKIDFQKCVAFGASYGGFMVLGCLYANPELWAAGVDIVGIANFVTFLRNTGPWRRKLRIAEYGDPDKDHDFLIKISPVSNAEKIKAPLFVIHGENDPRVPLEEAEQITKTLKELGREVHLLKFDAEGHGLHKIRDRIQGYSQAIAFLLDHLGDNKKKS